MKREQHIERDRIKREATAQRRRKIAGSAKPKKTRTPKPTPRRTLEPLPKTKDDYSAKLSSIKSDLNSLSLRIKNLPQSVNQLDNNINEINTRLQNLRNNRYHSQSYLEKMSIDLEKKWSNLSPNIQSYSLEQSNQLLQRKSNLESRINRAGSLDEIIQYGIILSDLNREYTSVENSLRDQLDGFQSQYQTLDDDLRTADETVSNLMNSSIGWKINEHPVLAVK